LVLPLGWPLERRSARRKNVRAHVLYRPHADHNNIVHLGELLFVETAV